MTNGRLDLIVFGATGFTGKYTVRQVARLCEERGLKFGISGRRKEALEAVMKEFANSEDLPILIADLKDEESLKDMTRQCKVLINCCGPYRFYGEPVIKACISTKTHYVDVSGEPQFIERMQLEYNEAAQEAGVYVISACAFCSVPCDLGIIFTQQKFEGEINSIETYLVADNVPATGGALIHYGTWESLVYSIAHMHELRPLRSKLYPNKLPKLFPPLKTRGILHKSAEGWSVVFRDADRSIAYRTQRFLYENYKQRPVQVQTYMTFGSIMAVLKLAMIGLVVSLMAKFECSRNWLLKYPSFFSGGFISHEGPSEEAMEDLKFGMIIKARGWEEKLSDPIGKHTEPPNKEMITKVSGSNPAYGATCICAALAAITILRESSKMPANGGVLTSGAAFAKTSLIEELNQNGLTFDVLRSGKINS